MVHGNMGHIHVEFRLNTFSTTTSKCCCMSAVQSGGGELRDWNLADCNGDDEVDDK